MLSLAHMLYEITIWRRSASGGQLLATQHELGHISTVTQAAKAMLRAFPGAGAAHYARISEAHNGREILVLRFDQVA